MEKEVFKRTLQVCYRMEKRLTELIQQRSDREIYYNENKCTYEDLYNSIVEFLNRLKKISPSIDPSISVRMIGVMSENLKNKKEKLNIYESSSSEEKEFEFDASDTS